MTRKTHIALLSIAATLASIAPCGLLLADASATAPSTRPVDLSIEPLIAQLRADDWRLRQQAQDQLIALGDSVVPALRHVAGTTTDEEVRTRINTALRQIEATAQWGPTLITLRMANVSAEDVIAELARQANVQIVPRSPNLWRTIPGTVSIDADRQPFWMVMRHLCEQTGLSPQRDSTRRRIVLSLANPDWARQPCFVHQGFMITYNPARRSRDRLDNAMGQPAIYAAHLTVWMDPKLRLLRAQRLAKLAQAVDEKGISLVLPPDPTYTRQVASAAPGSCSFDTQVMLSFAQSSAERLAVLKGSTALLVQAKADTWVVPDILSARGMIKPLPIGRYVIKRVTPAGAGRYRVQFTIEHHRDVQPGMHPQLDLLGIEQAMRLVDAAGNDYRWSGLRRTDDNDALEYTVTFVRPSTGPRVGEPSRLIWDIPAETQGITVPFEFRDVPVP